MTDTVIASSPFRVLGLTANANEEQIRQRYLELCKQFTPDLAPEKFQEINRAYQAIKDPESFANEMIKRYSNKSDLQWRGELDALRQTPPPLSPSFLLSLGNQ